MQFLMSFNSFWNRMLQVELFMVCLVGFFPYNNFYRELDFDIFLAHFCAQSGFPHSSVFLLQPRASSVVGLAQCSKSSMAAFFLGSPDSIPQSLHLPALHFIRTYYFPHHSGPDLFHSDFTPGCCSPQYTKKLCCFS